MSEIVKKCKVHGPRTIDQVYKSKDSKLELGFCYKCKECVYENRRNRPCKVHGDIPVAQRLPSGHCRVCSFESIKKATEKRNNNREWFNARQKLKRDANPEKYAEEYKKKHQRNIELYGLDALTERNKANQKGLTVEKLRQMMEDQKELCALCHQPESRIFRKNGTDEIRIAKLCIDHDHITGAVRELLCHDCNTGLGKFKDRIDLLEAAIQYLKKHNTTEGSNQGATNDNQNQ